MWATGFPPTTNGTISLATATGCCEVSRLPATSTQHLAPDCSNPSGRRQHSQDCRTNSHFTRVAIPDLVILLPHEPLHNRLNPRLITIMLLLLSHGDFSSCRIDLRGVVSFLAGYIPPSRRTTPNGRSDVPAWTRWRR